MEGKSLLPGLAGGGAARTDFPIESYDSRWPAGGKIPPYCGVRTKDWLYVRYTTGQQELYDGAAIRSSCTISRPTPADGGARDMVGRAGRLRHPVILR